MKKVDMTRPNGLALYHILPSIARCDDVTLQFRQWGRAAGRISAVKTATATANWAKSGGVLRLRRQDGYPGRPCGWMQTGADQTALTLPVGRVLFLFEPMMHGLALWRRILVSVIQRHRQNVQEIFQIPPYKTIGRVSRSLQAVVQTEGL